MQFFESDFGLWHRVVSRFSKQSLMVKNKRTKDGERPRLTVSLEPLLKQKIDVLARMRHRNTTNEVERLIEEEIARAEADGMVLSINESETLTQDHKDRLEYADASERFVRAIAAKDKSLLEPGDMEIVSNQTGIPKSEITNMVKNGNGTQSPKPDGPDADQIKALEVLKKLTTKVPIETSELAIAAAAIDIDMNELLNVVTQLGLKKKGSV